MGESFDVITKLCDGSHPFSATLKEAKKPLVILGADQLTRKDGAKILYETQALAKALGDNSNVNFSQLLYSNFIEIVIIIYLLNFRLHRIGKS